MEPFIPRVEAARKYVTAMEQAPPLQADGLGDGYVKLSEFEDTVLAGKDISGHGFQFITWQWNNDHTGLNHGHYYNEYPAAKEDFAQRSGLLPRHRQFSEEQAKALHQAASLTIEQGLFDSHDDYTYLLECQCKLEATYPELAEEVKMALREIDAPEHFPETEPMIEPTMTGM